MSKLIFIGMGLYDSEDISLKGLEALREANHIFVEFYTAKMAKGTIKKIESKVCKKVTILNRDQVEDRQIILSHAKKEIVAFLCQGDPFTATTHIELLLCAKQQKIETQIIHGASVVTAIPGLLGLQYYKFGRTTTIAYPEGEYLPESFYEVIGENLSRGLHTLVLLDIHSKEKRYMTANEGIELLLKVNSNRKDNIFTPDTLTCVVARAGSKSPFIAANKAKKLLNMYFGAPLHSLVIPGKLHFKEAEALMILANVPKKELPDF